MTAQERQAVAEAARTEINEHVESELEFTLTQCDSDPLTIEDFISDLAWRLRRRLGDPEAC